MDIDLIKSCLNSSDPQDRMKGVRELRDCEPDVAIPLLKSCIKDREFLVRSFVAMGLGRKQSAESFAALLEMIKFDSDPNVRAEAANSLSLYGSVSISHLTLMFERDEHWLVRRSIIAALADLDCPQEFFEVCAIGLEGEDLTVKESCINCLSRFANTDKQDAALKKLLPLTEDEYWRTRMQTARSLGKFNCDRAIEALKRLRTDGDHRVVGAVLENLV